MAMPNISLINGHIEKYCENCKHCDVDQNDQPCCNCEKFENWEESECDTE